MNPNSKKIDIAKQYTDLLKSIIGPNLISVFLFGSVVRSEDTNLSDIDIMTIVRDHLSLDQIEILGRSGRFNEIRGYGIFKDISCAVTTQDRFLVLLKKGAPREAINPLQEAVILYDTNFIINLKEELKSDVFSLKRDAHMDYIRYGDIRRFYLSESIADNNLNNARSDAIASVSHYLRAYFLYKYNEMIVSKTILKIRILEEKSTIATLYEKVLQGNHNYELVNAIREWVIEKISSKDK